MTPKTNPDRHSVITDVIAWGAMWGIFEATVGYLLHLFSFGYGWLVWYPAACFFMAGVYRSTGRASSVVCTGLLCASIKLINLFHPVRIDFVINPAVSIALESLAMALVVHAVHRLPVGKRKNPLFIALAALAVNTCWRAMYIAYILLLVPGWMRDISVVSDAGKCGSFLITQNLATGSIALIGYRLAGLLSRPIQAAARRCAGVRAAIPGRAFPVVRAGLVGLMLCACIALTLLL